MKHRILIPLMLLAPLALSGCDKAPDAPVIAAADAKPAADAESVADAKGPASAELNPSDKVEGIPEDGGVKGEAHDEGCLHGAEACEHKAPPAAGSAGHFGAPFSVDAAQPLSAAIASFADAGAEPVLVSGEVKAVCQAKGCWMVIANGELQARVLMKDHSFAVPMDGEGSAARVQGVLTEKTLSEAQVKHIEKDAGRDPSAVEGERKEYILTATGVELTRS